MQARVTLFEIDTLRVDLAVALELFKGRVVPRLRTRAGCQGVIVLTTPEGRGMVLSLWESADAANAAVTTGFYDEQVAEFTMFLRQPPGREQYEVAFHELGPVFAGQSRVSLGASHE